MRFSLPRIFLFLFLIFPLLTYAQEEDENVFQYQRGELTPLTFGMEEEEEEDIVLKKKKKRRKRKVFYGKKTKKATARSGFGGNFTVEIFHYLKVPEEVDPYVRDIYWFDFKRKTIRQTRNIDKKYGGILHGPYKKLVGDQVVEEGIYYVGTKHGRWMYHDKNDILVNKEKYYKGWPKESLVSYYDQEKTQLKEVIPVEWGKREGWYFYFHENGQVAVQGEYRQGQKVGVWTEYYPNFRRRKKEVQYPKRPFEKGFVPHILREWDDKGVLLYDRNTYFR